MNEEIMILINIKCANIIINMIADLKNVIIPRQMPCEVCAESKMTRLPFKANGTRAKSLLQLIHADVCGPMSTNSLGGGRYYVSFIDDYSRKCFVYIIRNKYQVFECFVKCKAMIENQLDKKIKIFRSDGGEEFDNGKFSTLFEQCGILHQMTAPHTPSKTISRIE